MCKYDGVIASGMTRECFRKPITGLESMVINCFEACQNFAELSTAECYFIVTILATAALANQVAASSCHHLMQFQDAAYNSHLMNLLRFKFKS